MDSPSILKPGSESQDSDEPAPPGTTKEDYVKIPTPTLTLSSSETLTPTRFKLKPSTKGVENAKKRLRAFSIQKKTPIKPITVPKASGGANPTVVIGKLTGVKVTPKVEAVQDGEQKKPPKPPKPGASRKLLQDSYTEMRKRTLTEIEDMKRKMELVELGIPLGLICPTSSSDKAMPTKAMPPIKTFLDPAKLDEIISEAKKAKAEGKEFKFDYSKLLPEYDNPFQRKKEDTSEQPKTPEQRIPEFRKKIDKDKRKTDRYENERRHSYRNEERHADERDKRDKYEDEPKRIKPKRVKETDVDLNEYLVCDSWSLENEDKTNSSSPKVDGKTKKRKDKRNKDLKYSDAVHSPASKPVKMQKLYPVMDSFKFEIDEDEILDMFDENTDLEKFNKIKAKKGEYDSPDSKLFDFDSTKDSNEMSMTDDTFLESVINEIKQEDISDEGSQDKGLVEYDSPIKEEEIEEQIRERLSETPELDDRMRDLQSSRSDYSDGYRSTESGYKSTESGYKSNASYKSVDSRSDSYRLSVEKEMVGGIAKTTVDSLETWSFVMKICQPLLFRHDRNKCYKETRALPKLWYTECPKACDCVKDRSVVYEELEMCKMTLVDRVYGCDQIPDTELPKARSWYPSFSQCLAESSAAPLPSSDWEADDSQADSRADKADSRAGRADSRADKADCRVDSRVASRVDKVDTVARDQRRGTTPQRSEEIYLDREYQRFMQAVWPEVAEVRSPTPRSTTPVRQESRKKKKTEEEKESEDKKRVKKIKLSSEGWSQESDVEEVVEKSKKVKVEKEKVRKRKISTSLSNSEDDAKKRKKELKKKTGKKVKSKASRIEAKRRRLGKKYLKKLKEKQKKKKIKEEDDSEDNAEKRKKEKKLKKKKLQKKKRAQKKKAKAKSSSSSSSSSSTSETDSEADRRKKKKTKTKKRKQSTSESQSEELFDVNILKNIKTERLTDDEKNQKLEFSPRKQKPREIINVKELQNDFVGNNIHIKQETKEVLEREGEVEQEKEREVAVSDVVDKEDNQDPEVSAEVVEKEEVLFKEPLEPSETLEPQEPLDHIPMPHESLSQCSSQDSIEKESYEKDESHLRPSSQNSNYSFHDVISASHGYQKEEDLQYEEGNYEMYEQLAMAYQSDVAKQPPCPDAESWRVSQRIETVVRGRTRGEIKCDWRASDAAPAPAAALPRPSRWGLKPGEVNIVLTGGSNEQSPVQSAEPVYQIQSLANRSDITSMGYDEAYEDMYGASDRLQYGDCFAAAAADLRLRRAPPAAAPPPAPPPAAPAPAPATVRSPAGSLDDRINHALRNAALGDDAQEVEDTDIDKDGGRDKGILVTKSLAVPDGRGAKRVSFADGYKPGQDSDVEEPPVRKKKKSRRVGCAWPCPASHPDHVPLWDALPPPPPPPGSPPPALAAPAPAPPPLHLLRQRMLDPAMMPVPPYPMPQKMDPSVSLPSFMPPEPPPGLINFS